jgi:hypothetical protein
MNVFVSVFNKINQSVKNIDEKCFSPNFEVVSPYQQREKQIYEEVKKDDIIPTSDNNSDLLSCFSFYDNFEKLNIDDLQAAKDFKCSIIHPY